MSSKKMTSHKKSTLMEDDEQFYDDAIEVEKQWRTSRPRFTDRELLQAFPEAKPLIRAKLAEWEARRNAVARVITQKLRLIDHLSAFKNHWFWYKWVSATDGQTLRGCVSAQYLP